MAEDFGSFDCQGIINRQLAGLIFQLYSRECNTSCNLSFCWSQGKLSLLAGSKDVDQLLKDIQMPDDQEIVGITERLVEQEPVTAATVSLSEQPVETITNGIQSVQTLDKVQWVCLKKLRLKAKAFVLLFYLRTQELQSQPKVLGTLDKGPIGDMLLFSGRPLFNFLTLDPPPSTPPPPAPLSLSKAILE